jgi:membrane protease YdiL (CAAX protease family)
MAEANVAGHDLFGGQPPFAADETVRKHVHVALGSVVLAFLGPLVTWTLVLWDLRVPATRWKRRLVALAVFDTLLFGALATSRIAGIDVNRETRKPPEIGVALEPDDTGRGAVIARVAKDSPAAVATLRDGDRIVAVDGRTVEDPADLAREIRSTRRGTARSLTVLRGGRGLELPVVPEADAPMPRQTPASLFQSLRRVPSRAPPNLHRIVLGSGAVDLVAVILLMVAARRRGAPTAPGFGVVAGLVALATSSALVLDAFRNTAGVSLGAILVAMLSGSISLLVVGLVAASLLSLPSARAGVGIPTTSAIGLGVFYGLTGAARVGIVVGLVAALLHLPLVDAAGAFGLSVAWGWLGVGLFLAASVLVAPIAEELLFRGILLPWLTGWMRPAWSVGISALVFALGHVYYGVGAVLIGFYGVVLGWARLRTGKLTAPIFLHGLLDATTAATLLAMSSR